MVSCLSLCVVSYCVHYIFVYKKKGITSMNNVNKKNEKEIEFSSDVYFIIIYYKYIFI